MRQELRCAWLTEVDILREQNKLDDLIPCYERIVEMDPTAQEAMVAMTNAVARYEEQKKPEKALEFLAKTGDRFREAVAGKPAVPEFLMPFGLAVAYLNLKQPDTAVAWLDVASDELTRSMSGKLNSPEALTERFQLAIAERETETAGQSHRMAGSSSRLRSLSGRSLRGARRCLCDEGRHAECPGRFQSHCASPSPQRFHAAQRCLEMQRPDEAIGLLDQILAVNGGDTKVYDLPGQRVRNE